MFLDGGRAFDDYTFASSRDGMGLGIHWGAGAGLYFTWGDAALLRFEFAYSPDAGHVLGLPMGVYVGDGVMF